MADLLLDKTFQVGLRPKAETGKNMPYLTVSRNAIPTPDGAVPPLTGLTTIPEDLDDAIFTDLAVTKDFPWPQLLRGRAHTFLCLEDAVHVVSESDWSTSPLQPIAVTPVNRVTNGTFAQDASGWTGASVTWEWAFDPSTYPYLGGHLQQISGAAYVTQAGVLTIGKTYYVSFNAITDGGGSITVKAGTVTNIFTASASPRAYSCYLTADGIDFGITASTGGNARISNIEVYEVQEVPDGGLWQLADFGDVYLLVNGACTLFVANYSQKGFTQLRTFIDTALKPNTVTNYRGRLLMGGFQGADTWAALWDTFWGTVASYTGTTGMPTDSLSPRHIWYSSIGGEDMLQYFLPEQLLERPGTTSLEDRRNLLCNGDFRRAGSAWVLTGGWTAYPGYLEHTAGTEDTVEQDNESMPIPIEVGTAYEVQVHIANRTAGTISVSLGSTSVLSTTRNGYTVARGICIDDATFTVTASSTFDGQLLDVSLRAATDTGWAEDIWLLGEQGQRALPWQGDVLAQHVLSTVTLVGTADGLVALSPSGSTLGATVVHEIGLAGRGALCGSQREALFVDRKGSIWRVGSDLSVLREGREEFLLSHLDEIGPIIYFNSDRDEYYIAFPDDTTFVVSRSGVGEMSASLFAALQLEGVCSYIIDDFTSEAVRMETDTIDFGTRANNTLRELEACFDGEDLSVTILNRMGSNDAWREVGPFTMQEAGRLIRSFSQTEFKVRLDFASFDDFTRFTSLRLTYNIGGRKAVADTLTLNNLL